MPQDKFPFPLESSITSEAEQLGQMAARMFASDAQSLRKAVVGKSERGFRHVRLSTAEEEFYYEEQAKLDDPAAWLRDVKRFGPKGAIKRWARLKERQKEAKQA